MRIASLYQIICIGMQYDIKMAAIAKNKNDNDEKEDVNADVEEKANSKTNVDDGKGDAAEEEIEEMIQIEASVNCGDVHSMFVSVTGLCEFPKAACGSSNKKPCENRYYQLEGTLATAGRRGNVWNLQTFLELFEFL